MRYGLVTSVLLTAAMLMPSSAAAVDYLGYPWPGAVDCSGSFGKYSWCIEGRQYSPYGFGYRNCTDFAAYRLNLLSGFFWKDFTTPTGGDGHAYAWRDNTSLWAAQGRADRYGRPWRVDRTPAAGAVAWWGPSSTNQFGHVAIVTDPTPDASGAVGVDQYNYAGHGEPSQVRTPAAKAYFLHIEDATLPPAAKSADVNRSGSVDIFDLSIMLSNWGTSASANNAALNSDLNWNGTVDLFDLSILLSRWNTTGRSAARNTSAARDGSSASAAGLSSMTLTPSARSVNAGDTVTVQVDLDAGQPTNAVEAQLVYPTDRFAYVDTQLNTNTWGADGGVTAVDGTVDVDAGSSAVPAGQQHLATVTFRALSSGSVPIVLGGLSSVISAATNAETLTGIFATAPGGGGEPTADQSIATSGEVGTVGDRPRGPSRAVIARSLRRLLIPAGRAGRIGALLRTGRYRFAFTAPAAGRMTIAWYSQPQRRARRSRTLLAAGAHRFRATGQPEYIGVKLTAAGKDALRHGTRRLTARVQFVPASGTPVTVTAGVRLRR